MQSFNLKQIEKYLKRPGLSGSFVHGDSMSLTHWTLQKGAMLASHSHPHEQITFIVSGKMQFERDGHEPFVALPGSFIIFPSWEVHGGVVLEDTVAVDAFSPVREDFKKEMEEIRGNY